MARCWRGCSPPGNGRSPGRGKRHAACSRAVGLARRGQSAATPRATSRAGEAIRSRSYGDIALSKQVTFSEVLRRLLRQPGPTIRVGLLLARGFYYRLKFRLRGQRVIIGRRFRVKGRLDIRGPGTVIFGDDCGVVSSRMAVTTPYTHSPGAVIRFGDRVLLTGTRLSCQELIDVGDGAGLSDARVMDTDFHALETGGRLRYNTPGASKPITVGAGAWLGAGSMVLKGVRIGANSVVGAGAVVATNVPPNCVVFGNPARVIWRMRGGGTAAGASQQAEPA